MAQNSFFMETIDCEAMKAAPTPTVISVITASLARNITLKTTQTFLSVMNQFNHTVEYRFNVPLHYTDI